MISHTTFNDGNHNDRIVTDDKLSGVIDHLTKFAKQFSLSPSEASFELHSMIIEIRISSRSMMKFSAKEKFNASL